jgi:hypothetical protein
MSVMTITLLLAVLWIVFAALYFVICGIVLRHRWSCPKCRRAAVEVWYIKWHEADFGCNACHTKFRTYVTPLRLVYDKLGLGSQREFSNIEILPANPAVDDLFFEK